MRVSELKLANVRAVEAAELQFQPGFNLLVGLNGVGKTTVLDALCVCLSAFVKHANALRRKTPAFAVEDVRVGTDALDVECTGIIQGSEHRYLIHKLREDSAPQEKKAGMPRHQVYDTPDRALFLGAPPEPATTGGPEGRPLAILFSTRRAVPSDRPPRKGTTTGGTGTAFAGAFSNRELRLGELAAWMRVQKALEPDRVQAARALKALGVAVSRFLPGHANLRVVGSSRPRLLIDRGSSTVAVKQMSDGERGTLALVLDLTRRLVQANPEMADPVAKAEAIVLIDEIDLHLHPKWQRRIVPNLTATFPRCQFVATTHSPQLVASVEPNRVSLLSPDGVKRPHRSRGTDSNWILRHLMEADDRPEDAAAWIQRVETLIREGEFNAAHVAIAEAKWEGLDLPEWSMFEARIARLEILAE